MPAREVGHDLPIASRRATLRRSADEDLRQRAPPTGRPRPRTGPTISMKRTRNRSGRGKRRGRLGGLDPLLVCGNLLGRRTVRRRLDGRRWRLRRRLYLRRVEPAIRDRQTLELAQERDRHPVIAGRDAHLRLRRWPSTRMLPFSIVSLQSRRSRQCCLPSSQNPMGCGSEPAGRTPSPVIRIMYSPSTGNRWTAWNEVGIVKPDRS